MDRLLSMRVFKRVVDEGGFAAAARALDMSPAVVTRLVADLEEHLGTRLLHRTTRRLSLSEAGETYLGRVRAILQDIDEAHDLASSHTNELAGVLHVLVSPVMVIPMLASILASFRLKYPNIVLDIAVESFDEPPVEDYDLTLFIAPDNYDGDVIARKIVVVEGIFVASPEYLKRKGTPRTPDDLLQHDCMRIRSEKFTSRAWRLVDSENSGTFCEIDVTPVLSVNHADTLLRLARDGAGITPLSVALAAPYLVSGELVQVLPPWILERMTVYAALPSRKYLPLRSKAFLEHLTEQIRALVGAATDTKLLGAVATQT